MAPFSQSTRPRRSLPEGYQFGDAGKQIGLSLRLIRQYDPSADRQPSAFDIDIMTRMQRAAFLRGAPDYDPAKHDAMINELCWNVIEGEHFTTDRDLGDEA